MASSTMARHIVIDGREFIELAHLSVLFPGEFPKQLVDQAERRKIITFLKKFLEGSGIEINDAIYKPYGIRNQGINKALLRKDYFDLIMTVAPGGVLPWSPSRRHYNHTNKCQLPVAELMEYSTDNQTGPINTLPPIVSQMVPNNTLPPIVSQTVPNNTLPPIVSQTVPNNTLSPTVSPQSDVVLHECTRSMRSTTRPFPQKFETDEEFWKACFIYGNDSGSWNEFSKAIKDFNNDTRFVKKKSNPLVALLFNLLLPNLPINENGDALEVQMVLESMLGNAKSVIAWIRQLLHCPFYKSPLLPSRLQVQNRTKQMGIDFRKILQPHRIPGGFYVNLELFVELVAFDVYSKTSLEGLRVDIYGDAMARGKRDVVRLGFRVLDTGYNTEQSSTHVYSFAVFEVCNM